MYRLLRLCAVPHTLCLISLLVVGSAAAQNNGGNQGGGTGGNGNGGVGGIRIDAGGLVEKSVTPALNARALQKQLSCCP